MADESQGSEGNRSVVTVGTGTSETIFYQSTGVLRGGADNGGSETSVTSEALRVRVNNLKYSFETWREILIQVYGLLIWKRSFYPMVLWAIVSLFFGIVCYAKLSTLTTLAILAIFAIISDYMVPKMQAHFFNPNLWTGVKEKKYEEVCNGIACAQENLSAGLSYLNHLKRSRPFVYFFTVLLCLFALAWIGSLMDNLLLTYVIVCSAMMIPGLVHRGYLRKYLGCAAASKQANYQAQKKEN
uniref:RETREG1-3/ARL6IP-like N-terminal reticulon-homology domain-containing protein n=1 Tax=Strigamia maritima TaxID=126957 RepID=T1IXY2_STRMM